MNRQPQSRQITWRCSRCRELLVGLDEIQRHRNPWLRLCTAMYGKKKKVIFAATPPPAPTVELGRGVVRPTVHEI